MSHIIIGGGPAGYHAARVLREAGEEVTLINKEAEPFYSRVLISHYLGGGVEREDLYLAGKDCYDRLGVNALLGRQVARVDADGKQITLDDGQMLTYERLLVASGGEPVLPPVQGLNLAGVFTLHTLADVEAIKSWLCPGEPAVIIGGGLVACRAAEALHALGVPVSLVEIMDHLLPQVLDAAAAALFQETLISAGLQLFLADSVVAIEGEEKVQGVRLKSGSFLPCHLVVVATGVKPALAFLEATGIQVNRGILVNEYLESSIPGIYAAGDVAEARDIARGEARVNALWPNAVTQGALAGANMAGAGKVYNGGMGLNTLEMFGLRVVSFGLTRAPEGCQEVVVSLPARKFYRKLVYQGQVLKGGILVEQIAGSGILYWMTMTGKALSNPEVVAGPVPLEYVALWGPEKVAIVN